VVREVAAADLIRLLGVLVGARGGEEDGAARLLGGVGLHVEGGGVAGPLAARDHTRAAGVEDPHHHVGAALLQADLQLVEPDAALAEAEGAVLGVAGVVDHERRVDQPCWWAWAARICRSERARCRSSVRRLTSRKALSGETKP
jgi:hypothetical protein